MLGRREKWSKKLGSRCLRPGSGAFFKGNMFIRNISGYNNDIETNLAHRQISPSLTFLSDNAIFYVHVACHVTRFLKISHI